MAEFRRLKRWENSLNGCIRCGYCYEHCPIYKSTRWEVDSPRGKLTLLFGLLSGEIEPSDYISEKMFQCFSCKQCEQACSSGVPATQIFADVTDDGVVTSVKLFTSFNSSPFDSSSMSIVSGDTYEGFILPKSDGTQVQYFIKAKDDSGLTSVSSTYNYTVTTGGGFIPIADIQNNPGYIGQQVTIEGVVTLGAGISTTSWTGHWVQTGRIHSQQS